MRVDPHNLQGNMPNVLDTEYPLSFQLEIPLHHFEWDFWQIGRLFDLSAPYNTSDVQLITQWTFTGFLSSITV